MVLWFYFCHVIWFYLCSGDRACFGNGNGYSNDDVCAVYDQVLWGWEENVVTGIQYYYYSLLITIHSKGCASRSEVLWRYHVSSNYMGIRPPCYPIIRTHVWQGPSRVLFTQCRNIYHSVLYFDDKPNVRLLVPFVFVLISIVQYLKLACCSCYSSEYITGLGSQLWRPLTSPISAILSFQATTGGLFGGSTYLNVAVPTFHLMESNLTR